MNDSVCVKVVEFADRRHYQMQWLDPMSGRKKTRSTQVERTGRKKERTEAERVAAKFEADLRAGRYCRPSQVLWSDFRERYETERLAGLAVNTETKVCGIFNRVESVLNPNKLRELTAQRVSYYQSQLRTKGASESTIKAHLAHLKAALRWGERVGLMDKAPRIEMPKRASGAGAMRGRAVTGEEYERLLAKIPAVVAERAVPSWAHYLEGLWWSGLRLAESLKLSWSEDGFRVEMSGKHPMLSIRAEAEKAHRDRLLPLAPEFAAFLDKTPEAERVGPVFNPLTKRGERRASVDTVCRLVAKMGRAANVKVSTDPKTGKVRCCTAHDFRRSFAVRWAARIMPNDLMILMRHSAFQTTMQFYLGQNAEKTAQTLWAAYETANAGNTFGNTSVLAENTVCRKSL